MMTEEWLDACVKAHADRGWKLVTDDDKGLVFRSSGEAEVWVDRTTGEHAFIRDPNFVVKLWPSKPKDKDC